jgi:hypothetical protein
VTAKAYGNVLLATAILCGAEKNELAAAELEHDDPRFPIVTGVRAVSS